MARYFNRTRGPVTVSLRNGESTIVRPKGTLTVPPEQDGSASLHAKVRKKLLVRLEESLKPAPVVTAPPPEKPLVVEEPEPEVFDEDEPADDDYEEDAPVEVPSMQWTKVRLVEFAESLDLDVSFNSTKVEILQAIEEAGR